MKFSLAILASIVGSAMGQTGLFEVIGANGNYTTLVALAQQANITALLDTLSTLNSKVTIFGPTDDAFAALGDALDNLTNTELVGILYGHAVAGEYTAKDVHDAGCVVLDAINGNKIKAEFVETGDHGDHDHRSLHEGMVHINDFHVAHADLNGTEGLFHGIEGVLTADNFSPCPAPAPAPSGDSDGTAASVVGASVAMIASIVSAFAF
eukprot:scaffold14_cov130-Cylindrotheca_fusiformis.AAC.6